MLLVKNRKAFFNHEIIEKYIAGISLFGFEVKAIREGKVSFETSYIRIEHGQAYIINLYIGSYSKQSKTPESYDEKRDRKLLLNKGELIEMQKLMNEEGKTAVPLAFILRNNKIKLELAVVKGRKEFEKKLVAKEKQIKKDLERDYRNIIRGANKLY